MNFFRRRRRERLDLGRYHAPVYETVPPVQRIVDEGLLVAISGIRMAVKNRMIVAALRDGLDYDHAEYAAFATARILEIADREAHSAVALRSLIESEALVAHDPDRVESERREQIRLGLADALRTVAHDAVALGVILDHARDAALDDIATTLALSSSDTSQSSAEHYTAGPDYENDKGDRVAALVMLDLARLAAEHNTSLDQLSE